MLVVDESGRYLPGEQEEQSAASSCSDASDAASTKYLPAAQAVQLEDTTCR